MDGTRMGSRSSTRHGPAAVFSGPVRRWRKAWAPISSSSSSAASSSSSSRILLYKWVPLAPGGKDEGLEEPTPHTVRYMPVSIVLAQKKEASRRASEEVEAAAQQNADASGETEAQADTLEQLVVSAEVKVSDSPCASEEQEQEQGQEQEQEQEQEQGPVADAKDVPVLEEQQSKSSSPLIEEDVVMADEVQEEAEDVKPPVEAPPGLDLESTQVPSEWSPKSEAEG